MLCLVYYAGADLYLIDPNVLDVSKPVAIGISLASIAFGWIIYDLICKSPFGNDNTRLMVLLYFILAGMAWGYTQLFTGRAAFLHLGAFTATIMSANVFFIIIPNQKIVVADLIAGSDAGCKIRQDRQAAFDAQQLPDAARSVPDAVEPLSAGVRAQRTTGSLPRWSS